MQTTFFLPPPYKKIIASILTISTGLVSLTAFANPLPTGGTFVGGSGSISTSGHGMTVKSTTDNSIVNWQSFDIGSGYTVFEALPSASSSIMNRVTGGSPSQIFGTLSSNGHVYLINPAGIYFAKGSQVNVGSLFASTLGISDTNFMNHNFVFERDSATAPGAVINAGTITIKKGGFAVLAGGAVENRTTGIINAPGGTTALVVGDGVQVTLDPLVGARVTVTKELAQAVTNYTTAIANAGHINADGGMVKLEADLKNTIYDLAINHTGMVQADSVAFQGGAIEFIAKGNGNNASIQSTGLVNANGTGANPQAGTIAMTADQDVTVGNTVSASGFGGAGVPGSVQITAGHDIITTGGLNTQSSNLQMNAQHNIGLDGDTTALMAALTAGGSIHESTGVLKAGTVQLAAGQDISKDGTSATFQLNTTTLTANSTKQGVRLTNLNTNPLHLTGINHAGREFVLNNKGDLDIDGTVSTKNGWIALQSSDGQIINNGTIDAGGAASFVALSTNLWGIQNNGGITTAHGKLSLTSNFGVLQNNGTLSVTKNGSLSLTTGHGDMNNNGGIFVQNGDASVSTGGHILNTGTIQLAKGNATLNAGRGFTNTDTGNIFASNNLNITSGLNALNQGILQGNNVALSSFFNTTIDPTGQVLANNHITINAGLNALINGQVGSDSTKQVDINGWRDVNVYHTAQVLGQKIDISSQVHDIIIGVDPNSPILNPVVGGEVGDSSTKTVNLNAHNDIHITSSEPGDCCDPLSATAVDAGRVFGDHVTLTSKGNIQNDGYVGDGRAGSLIDVTAGKSIIAPTPTATTTQGLYSGDTVLLKALGGDIGSSIAPVRVATHVLGVNALVGSADVNQLGQTNFTLLPTSSVGRGQTLNVQVLPACGLPAATNNVVTAPLLDQTLTSFRFIQPSGLRQTSSEVINHWQQPGAFDLRLIQLDGNQSTGGEAYELLAN